MLLKNILKKSVFTFILSTVFFIFSTIPYLVFFCVSKANFAPILGHFAFYFFNALLSSKRIRVKRIIISDSQKNIFIGLLLVIGIVLFGLSFGVNFNFASNIGDVYDQRENYLSNSNAFTGYLYSSYANIFCPFVMYYGLEKKNKVLAIIGLLFCIYLGLVSGLKTTFLNVIFIVFFYFFKGSLIKKIYFFLIFIIVLLFSLIYINYKFDNNLINDLLVRRTMFTNPLITDAFFTVFENEKMYLRHSVFKSFSLYDGRYPNFMVGDYLFGEGKNTNANTGFIADGFMNFGYFGMFLYTMIASLILFYLKSLNVNEKYFGIYFIMMMGMIEMELTVMFFTHGMFFLLMLSTFLFNREPYKIEKLTNIIDKN